MRSLVGTVLLVVVLLAAGGLVWAHGPSRGASTPPSAAPAHDPGKAMTPMMQGPEAMQSMMEACLRAMDDPQMQQHMREHMSDSQMQRMMDEMMRGMMPGMPMMPMMPGPMR